MVTIKKAPNSKAATNLPPQNTHAVKGGLNFTKIKVEYQTQSPDL